MTRPGSLGMHWEHEKTWALVEEGSLDIDEVCHCNKEDTGHARMSDEDN